MGRLVKNFCGRCVLLIVFCCQYQLVYAEGTNPDHLLQIGNAEIEVYFGEGVGQGDYILSRQDVLKWIDSSAHAVSDYFLQFPVKKLRMLINGGANRRVNGIAYHGSHPMIIINIRDSFTKSTLAKDWVMVHEMVHLSFPPVFKKHNWLLEGLATYVEPIVRVRAGLLKEDGAWKWLIEGTPQGLPEEGNKGLDNTSTWGQKYWGGAIFFLLADMRIHQQTNNKFGIEHAIREVQKHGGSMQTKTIWDIEKILTIADKGTDTKVLTTLYHEMKDKAVMTDLGEIWQRLGVQLKEGTVFYNEAAKQLKLRKSLFQDD